MKRVVRRGCFETNSSSQHSIVVLKEDGKYDPETDFSYGLEHENHIDVWSEEDLTFGRYPFEILSTLEEKVCYAIASYCGYMNRKFCESFVEKLVGIIREDLPDFKEIILPKENKRVYLDIDGKELTEDDVHYRNTDNGHIYVYVDDKGAEWEAEETDYTVQEDYYGYVDHQSSGLLEGFLKKNNITLKEFLFNKKYIVIIDGDEYNTFGKACKAGIIDLNNMEQIFPVHDEYGVIPFDSVEAFEKLDELK